MEKVVRFKARKTDDGREFFGCIVQLYEEVLGFDGIEITPCGTRSIYIEWEEVEVISKGCDLVGENIVMDFDGNQYEIVEFLT